MGGKKWWCRDVAEAESPALPEPKRVTRWIISNAATIQAEGIVLPHVHPETYSVIVESDGTYTNRWSSESASFGNYEESVRLKHRRALTKAWIDVNQRKSDPTYRVGSLEI